MKSSKMTICPTGLEPVKILHQNIIKILNSYKMPNISEDLINCFADNSPLERRISNVNMLLRKNECKDRRVRNSILSVYTNYLSGDTDEGVSSQDMQKIKQNLERLSCVR